MRLARASALGLGLGTSLSLLLASNAFAVAYGTSVGTNVTYQNVTDGAGLFGAPTISGDNLDFSPTNFELLCPSVGCPTGAPTFLDDTLTFKLIANDNNVGIVNITIAESGDTSLFAIGAALGLTSVDLSVHVQIEEINGVPVVGFNPALSVSTTVNLGSFDTTIDGNGTFVWSGNSVVDLDAMIALAGLSGRATKVDFSMDNTLFGYAASGATVRIEKKDIGGLTVTGNVPEPGTALLLGIGLAGLSSIRRQGR